MTGSLIIGIDAGRYSHGVVALGTDGEAVVSERVAKDAPSIEALVDRVTDLGGGPGHALWVIEADGGDGIVLIDELLARDELVTILTPTEVAVRRKGRRQVHKSDLIDAELCAQIGREQQVTLRRLVAMPEAVAEMRILARCQEGLIRGRTGLINRLRFLLSQYWPEFLAARACATLDGDAVTALLTELPTPTRSARRAPSSWRGSWRRSAIGDDAWSTPSSSSLPRRSGPGRRRPCMATGRRSGRRAPCSQGADRDARSGDPRPFLAPARSADHPEPARDEPPHGPTLPR
jgi:hypothetical protein